MTSNVRAVTDIQVAFGMKWITLVRELHKFREGNVVINGQVIGPEGKVDGSNLQPGSNIGNLTQALGVLEGALKENVKWADAEAMLTHTMDRAMDKLTGTISKGVSLVDALNAAIGAKASLNPQQKSQMKSALAITVENIKAQTRATKYEWTQSEDYTIPAKDLVSMTLNQN